MNVSACLVTRGDVDMAQPLAAVMDAGITDVVVWDNSEEFDLAVFGRYRAIERAYYDVIYVQDDDCVIEPHAIRTLIAAHQPGKIIANMPLSRWTDYPDSCLVGWGAIFDRHLPTVALDRFLDHFDGTIDENAFWRECDVPFTVLTPHVKLDVGFRHLPWAEDPARAMYLRSWRQPERDHIYQLSREVRDW